MFFTAYFYACHFRPQLQWNNELWVDIIKFTVVILLFKKHGKKTFFMLSHMHSPLCSRPKGDFLPREETGACPDGPRQPNYDPSAASRGKMQESMCARACVSKSWFYFTLNHNFTQLMMLQLIPICVTQSENKFRTFFVKR